MSSPFLYYLLWLICSDGVLRGRALIDMPTLCLLRTIIEPPLTPAQLKVLLNVTAGDRTETKSCTSGTTVLVPMISFRRYY
jgi:hypothetical protein